MAVRTAFVFIAAVCFPTALCGLTAAAMHLRCYHRMSGLALAEDWPAAGAEAEPAVEGRRHARRSFRPVRIRTLTTGRRPQRSTDLTANRRRPSTCGRRVICPARCIVVPD